MSLLRSMLRPVYGLLVRRNPVMRAVLRHEIAQAGLVPKDWGKQIIEDFIARDYGKDYGVTADERRQLAEQFARNTTQIAAATGAVLHVVLAREILSIPPSRKGDVVECGVYKGASSASLSLVCRRTGRRLLVCDSFAGLPDEGGQLHVAPHAGIYGHYRRGMFCGRLEEVKANIAACGAPEACEYVVGYFAESLKSLHDPVAFAFLDVDLVGSTQDCLRHIWPLLVEEGAIFTDDAGDLACVKTFFDDAWWKQNLGCEAPGFVGSGCGLPLNPECSTLGYIRKLSRPESKLKRVGYLHYPDKSAVAS
ncbi:MAG: class I SAM-dependent methyltransferase [Verrucomicrobia bacterium]|nr:class I SAM-dependent methyltransferase [Verrucomicrobiota bacterium]